MESNYEKVIEKVRLEVLERIDELKLIVSSYEKGIKLRKNKRKKLMQDIKEYELKKREAIKKIEELRIKLAIIELN